MRLLEGVGLDPLFLLNREGGPLNKTDIVRHAWAQFEPELQEQGFELVEAEYVIEDGRKILRVYIDKPDAGITLDDCTAAAQVLSPLLDAESFIEDRFFLEVSSPGFERPLRKPNDFIRFDGEQARLTTNAPTAGRKRFSGILRGFEDGLIKMECDGNLVEIHIENLKKANLVR